MSGYGHIVNATEIDEPQKASYLHVAQPVTMACMVRARAIAAHKVDVTLCSVEHQEEEVLNVPPEFVRARGLTSYAWERIDALRQSSDHKPLPRLVDILRVGAAALDVEYLIFSNVDISPRPAFYLQVRKFLSQGYDALCINRQNLPKTYEGVVIDRSTVELGQSLAGSPTPGIDCFVFRKEILPRLDLGNTFVGFPPVGQVLKTQIEKHSHRFLWVKEGFYTFHLGDDYGWGGRSLYREQNEIAAQGLFEPCILPPSLWRRLREGPKRRIIRWALRQSGRA